MHTSPVLGKIYIPPDLVVVLRIYIKVFRQPATMSQQSILDKELHEAIEMQDLPAAESLLNQGANPNATDSMWYMSALQTAARRDNVKLV